jgi:hypothetical protein
MDRRPEPATPDDGNEQRTARARIPRAADGGSRRVALIALAIGLCVVVAGVATAVISSPGGGQVGHIAGAGNTSVATAPAAQPTPPVPSSRATTPSSRATTQAGAASDGLAKSVLRWPPGHTRQILRWDAGPGGKALAAISEQMGIAMQAAGLEQYAQMKLACAQLASDVGAARAEPPIPDNAMQELYAKALAGLSRAAADCHTAISIHIDDESTDVHVNRPLLNRSRVEFAAASKKLYRATGEIEALHH